MLETSGPKKGIEPAFYSVAGTSYFGGLFDVLDENVDQYVTHSGNSNGRIQEIGRKLTNSFGIELGNVYKISKDIYNSEWPSFGRTKLGGSWSDDIQLAKSAPSNLWKTIAGFRWSDTGFSLVRTCVVK